MVSPEVGGRRITTGACVSVEGELVASPGKGQAVELKARALHGARRGRPGGVSAAEEEAHTWKRCARSRTCAPRSNTFGAVFRVRNALAAAIHKFFQERGFLYVHTPIISASDAEGAGAMFRVTTLDLGEAGRTSTQDFFGTPHVPDRQRPAGGRDLRAGLHQRLHVRPHLPRRELEHAAPPGRVLDDRAGDGVLRSARATRTWPKRFSRARSSRCWTHCRPTSSSSASGIDARAARDARACGQQPVRAHHLHRSRRACCRSPGGTWSSRSHWGADLQSEHERYLTEEVFKRPVIVTDYPREIKAFYMRANDDGKTVARHGRAGAAHRRDHRRQPARGALRRAARTDPRAGRHGMREEAYWWYLDLRRFGGVRARRLRPGLRAHDDVHHRHEEHPRRDPVPAHARQRGVLSRHAALAHRHHRRAARPRPGPARRGHGPLRRAGGQPERAAGLARLPGGGPGQRPGRAGRGVARRPSARQVPAANRGHLRAAGRAGGEDARRAAASRWCWAATIRWRSARSAGSRSYFRDKAKQRRADLARCPRRHEHAGIEPERQRARHAAGLHRGHRAAAN